MSIPDDRLAGLPGEASDIAVLEPAPQTRGPVATGPCCEKCGAPFKSDKVTVCRRCGWYSSLNQFVEVDQDFEAYHDEDFAQPAAKEAPKSHVQVWSSLLPRWSWILIATVILIIVESVAVRLLTDDKGSIRMYLSVAQLAIGIAAVTGCHIFNFLVSATEDTDIGFLDVFIKPVALWLRAMKNLPRRLWVADGALGGATAVVMSIVVIGALPYDALWNWGGEKQKKPNMLASAVQQAQRIPNRNSDENLAQAVGGVQENGGGAKDLESAVGEMANQGTAGEGNDGDSGTGSGNAGNQAKTPKEPTPRQQIVCVILGYRLDKSGHVSSLVLGALHDDKLRYAGVVTPPADDAAMIDLTDDLERSQVEHPEVPLYIQANWVVPKFVCQVNYQDRDADGRLVDIKWEGLRGKLEQPSLTSPSSISARQ